MAVEQASSRNTVTAAEADTTDYYYKMCVTARLHENERPLSCQLYRHVSVIVYVDDVTAAVIRHAECNLLLSVSRLTLVKVCAIYLRSQYSRRLGPGRSFCAVGPGQSIGRSQRFNHLEVYYTDVASFLLHFP